MESLGLKRVVSTLCMGLAAGVLLSCGSSSSSSSSSTTSKLKKRVFVSNEFPGGASQGQLQIIDSAKDQLSTFTVQTSPNPMMMVEASDKTKTLVYCAGGNVLAVADNAQEALIGSVTMPGAVTSLVATPDLKTAYVAVPDTALSGHPAGMVAFVDLTNGTVTTEIQVTDAQTLALSPDGKKLLVFSNDSDAVSVIDTSAKTVTTVNGFDRPVFGVFTTDNSKAYIMNCGPQCGGTVASVSALTMSSLTIAATTPVAGATTGLLDSSGNLFVAGTTGSGSGTTGKLTVLNASSLAPTGTEVTIADGFHTQIISASNNKLLIGGRTCNTSSSCLSVYDTSAKTAVIPNTTGDATGMAAIPNRNVVYVAQGGELIIIDTTTSQPLVQPPNTQPIDIVGKAWDVVVADP